MSEASKNQRYSAGALSACCNACDATCCPSGTCASIAERSSKSTKNTNPRSAMSLRPSLLHLGSALRILWSSSYDPKARNCWPRLHPSSLFEMYCRLRYASKKCAYPLTPPTSSGGQARCPSRHQGYGGSSFEVGEISSTVISCFQQSPKSYS